MTKKREQGEGEELSQAELFLSTEEGKRFEKGKEAARDTIKGILHLVSGDMRNFRVEEQGTIHIGIPDPFSPFRGIVLKLDPIEKSAKIKILIDRDNRVDLGDHGIIQMCTDGERLILTRRGTLPGSIGLNIEFTSQSAVEFRL